MSVASRNPFALLDEESSRPSTPAANSAQPKEGSPATSTPPATQKSRGGGPASRGGGYYRRGRGGRDGARDENQAPEEDAGAGTDGRQKRYDGEGRGRGRGRGGRGGGRGRPFDRQNASGRTDSDKKVHQGWGGDEGNTELKVEEEGTNDAVVETNNDWAGPTATTTDDWTGGATVNDDAWGAPAAASGAAEDSAPAVTEERSGDRPGRREREPEEEDNTLTLDQYLAKKKEETATLVPKLETRKANEGDDTIWKDAVALKKSEDTDAYFAGKSKAAPKTRAKKEDKVYIEIDARFERPSRGRGGRGGGDRGGERGGRGRGRGGGRGRPNGSTAPVVSVDDETAFPALA